MHTNALILGAGPAGYTAALYTARAGLSTTLIMGPQPGGQLILTNEIENYPGHPHISGADLIDFFRQQASEAGVQLSYEAATSVDLSHRPFSIQTDMGHTWTSDTLIVATGSSNRWLHLPNEDTFKGRGISICATCDGFFYRHKHVAIIGGGNSAVYEALFLSKLAQTVLLVFPQEKLSAEHILLKQLETRKNVILYPHHQMTEFIGQTKLQAIRCQNTQTNDTITLPIDGVFEAIGQIPNSDLFKGQLDIDDKGFILTNKETYQTSVDGVFACGDIQEPQNRQAIIAAGTGCLAALNADRFLAQHPTSFVE